MAVVITKLSEECENIAGLYRLELSSRGFRYRSILHDNYYLQVAIHFQSEADNIFPVSLS